MCEFLDKLFQYPACLPHIPELLESHTERLGHLIESASLGLMGGEHHHMRGQLGTHCSVPGKNDLTLDALQSGSMVTP